MIHSLTLTLIGALLSISATAQTTTTYLFPSGTVCTNIEGCYYENLTAPGPLYGRFEAGGYWTQFQYEAYLGQNPGYKAQYCNGTAVWTSALMDNGHTFYTMDCNASADGTSSDPPAKIHVEIEAHSYVETYVCGVRVRTICRQTRWTVDSGDLAITQ